MRAPSRGHPRHAQNGSEIGSGLQRSPDVRLALSATSRSSLVSLARASGSRAGALDPLGCLRTCAESTVKPAAPVPHGRTPARRPPPSLRSAAGRFSRSLPGGFPFLSPSRRWSSGKPCISPALPTLGLRRASISRVCAPARPDTFSVRSQRKDVPDVARHARRMTSSDVGLSRLAI